MGNTIVKSLLPYLAEFSAWLVKLQKDSGFFSAVALTVIDVLKLLGKAVFAVYAGFMILSDVVAILARTELGILANAINAQVQLVKVWFDALKAIGSELLNVGQTAGAASQILLKTISGDYVGAFKLAKKTVSEFGDEAKGIGATVAISAVRSAEIVANGVSGGFQSARGNIKSGLEQLTGDLAKLATQYLNLFGGNSPTFPGAHAAPLEKPTTSAPGVISPETLQAIRTAQQLLEQMRLEEMTALGRLTDAENVRYQKQLERIDELKQKGADTRALEEQAAQEHQEKLTEIDRQALEIRAQIDRAAKDGDIQRTADLLNSAQALRLADLQAQQGFIQTITNLWNTSFQTLHASVLNLTTTVLNTFSGSMSKALTNIITGAQKASDAFADLGKSMIGAVVGYFSQLLVNTVLYHITSQALGKSAYVAAVGQATALAAINAGSAVAAAIASFGEALVFGPVAIGQILAGQAVGAGLGAALGGVAHGGLDFVPAEQTFLLQRGERVIKPDQNEDLTNFLDDKRNGQPAVIELHLDGYMVGRALLDMSKSGRLEISKMAVR